MAAVFAATHRNRSRVAIKILLPEFACHPVLRERFLREGYLTNSVGHPGAVRVFDDDVDDDGSVFLVMELLEGETLDRHAERLGGKLAVGSVLDILDRLLAVLEAAHAEQIIHRDLKPENIFLTRDGDLRVLDFGIARLHEVSERLHLTRAGQVLGTPGFMSPEQALGDWERVDERSDLWAVGALAWTLLVGREVHEAPGPMQKLMAAAMLPVQPLCEAEPAVPKSVGQLIDRALASDPDDRWPSAESMRDEIAMLDVSIDSSFDLAPLTADDILDEEVDLTWLAESGENAAGPTLPPPGGDSVAWYAAEERLAALVHIDSPEQQARELFEVASFYADDLADQSQASNCLHQALAVCPDHKPSFEKLETLLTAARQWDLVVDLYLLRRDAIEDEGEKAQLTNRALVVLCDRVGDLDRARALCAEIPDEDLGTTWNRKLGRRRRTGA